MCQVYGHVVASTTRGTATAPTARDLSFARRPTAVATTPDCLAVRHLGAAAGAQPFLTPAAQRHTARLVSPGDATTPYRTQSSL